MAGSIIIYGGSKKTRKARAVERVSKFIKKVTVWEELCHYPDIKILEIPNEKKSIGIGDIREVTRFANEKPFSYKNKFLVINDANTLTREAQNALLKTLEEPPSFTTIILLTKTLNDLLDTVVSRCKKVQALTEKSPSKNKDTKSTPDTLEDNSLARILRLNYGRRLEWASEFSKEEREDVVELLEKWLAEARDLMLDSPSTTTLKDVKLLYKTKKVLESTNAGIRLALEALVVNLSGTKTVD